MAICTDINKATPDNFELIFPLVPPQTGIAANNELLLNIHSVVLPSISLNPIELPYQNAMHKCAGGPLEFEMFNIQFVVDGSFKNWQLLFNWMTHISNGHDKMMENYKEFAVDSTLRIGNNFNQTVLGCKFKGMWPTNLQEVSLSYKEGEVLLESGATFVYDYFTISDTL